MSGWSVISTSGSIQFQGATGPTGPTGPTGSAGAGDANPDVRITGLTQPSNSGFSWVNQGGASLTDNTTYLTLAGAASGAGASLTLRVKTAPTGAYTLIAYLQPLMVQKAFQSYGLCFRESSTGKIAIIDILAAAATGMPVIRSSKFTSATAFSADYTTIGVPQMYRWFKIADDTTNRKVSFSADGSNWIQLHSVSRTDFLTGGADQIGFHLSAENSSTPNYAPIVNLWSWAVS